MPWWNKAVIVRSNFFLAFGPAWYLVFSIRCITMKESDTPQSQDNAADHSDNPKNRGALNNLPPRIGGNPPSPREHTNPNGNSGQPPWWKRLETWKFIGEIILIVVGIRVACIYAAQLEQMQAQVRLLIDIELRPAITVKMLDSIQVEVGKPVTATVEVFNYGKLPGMARAQIHVEVGPRAIEKFRLMLRDEKSGEGDMPDIMGFRKIYIAPGQSTKGFPIDPPERIFTQQDVIGVTTGTIDVAVYGRIFYTDLNNHYGYSSAFCFYRLKDGTTSACPDEKNAYTNFAP
jgi:hypothetical protein